MARPRPSHRIHDIANRESWDKIILGLAFLVGVGGGIALKLLAFHPFMAASFSASVLILYATLAYSATALRLEPEVIGDNAYYLGFLFTLTSLAVTLYFVVEAGAERRAELIPEVISGFGVALVSTIVGVFIRVLMMQFRLDLVAREHETRLELDDVARRLRVELAQSVERVKAFTVESLQHSAERESEFRRSTDVLVKGSQTMLTEMARTLREETARSVQEHSQAAVDSIRGSIASASETALTQIRTSFEDMAAIAEQMRATQTIARASVEQSIIALQLQGAEVAEQVAQLSRRIRTIAEETETAGASLAQGLNRATAKLETSLEETNQRLTTGFARFDQSALDAATRSQAIVNVIAEKLHGSVRQFSTTVTAATKEIDKATDMVAANMADASSKA